MQVYDELIYIYICWQGRGRQKKVGMDKMDGGIKTFKNILGSVKMR